MNPTDLEKLKKLLGPDFSREELEELLKEDPNLPSSAEAMTRLFQKTRGQTPPPLRSDFTRQVMERLRVPSVWERVQERYLNIKVLSWAGACAVVLLAALLILPRFFKGPSSDLAVQERLGEPIDKVLVRFSIKNPKVHSVSVAGDFNQWNEVPLIPSPAEKGLFMVEMPLPRGTYAYSFLLDGKKWVPDPEADRSVEDGFGNKNSLINL